MNPLRSSLSRREALQLGAAALSLPLLGCSGGPPRRPTPSGWAAYPRTVVIDGLAFVGRSPFAAGPPENRLSPKELGHLRDSGITALNVTIGWLGPRPDIHEFCLAEARRWNRVIEADADQILLVRRAADIAEAKASRRAGIVLGFQDPVMLGEEVARIDEYHALGVRVIQLTYNGPSALGDGVLAPGGRGLTDFGRAAVARMNDLGVLVDVSHCGLRTTVDALEASRSPIAITHAGCAALTENPRNKSDDVLRRLAARGGVFGVFLMPFLNAGTQPMAEDVIRHVEHAIKTCGEDHVGIGTDLPIAPIEVNEEFRAVIREELKRRRALGVSAPGEREDVLPLVPDLNHPRRLEQLAAMLSARGHSDARIEKVLGGNFLRLFRQVWG